MGFLRPTLMKRRHRSRKTSEKKLQISEVIAHIETIPRELVSEVLARVAASSFSDLFNAKLSCKLFRAVSEEKYIYQNVSLERFPVVPTSEEASSFLDRCRECENPEALYRQGVLDFFSHEKLETGIDYLKRAISKGHIGALYAMGIILLFFGGEFKSKGVTIINELKKSNLTSTKARDLRENLKDAITKMWVRNSIVLQQRPSACCSRQDHRFNAWDYDKTRARDCEGCQCDLDIDFICQYFRSINFDN